MAQTTLAIAGASTLAVSMVYGYVGLRLLRAAPERGPTRSALLAFSLWWLATAVNQFIGSCFYLTGALGYTDVDLQLTYVYLQRLLLALSLVGLMHYLIYLQTGRGRLVALSILYGLYLATQLYLLNIRTPIGVESYQWRTDVVYAETLPRAWGLTNLAVVVPPIVGALMMLRAYPRLETPTRRFRVATIGVGFTLWWLVAVAAGQPATYDVGWLQALNRVVGILVAIAILLSYEPLPWMQRRYALEPFAAQG